MSDRATEILESLWGWYREYGMVGAEVIAALDKRDAMMREFGEKAFEPGVGGVAYWVSKVGSFDDYVYDLPDPQPSSFKEFQAASEKAKASGQPLLLPIGPHVVDYSEAFSKERFCVACRASTKNLPAECVPRPDIVIEGEQ